MKAPLFGFRDFVAPRGALAALLCCCLLPACKEEGRNQQAVQAAIEREIAERVNFFRDNRMQRCHEQALEEASLLADSILLKEARLERDTIGKPPILPKPEKPEIKSLLDSLPIGPLVRPPALPPLPDTAGTSEEHEGR
jgi:hypothetical protein